MIKRIEELETAFDGYSPSMSDDRIRHSRLERMERLLDKLDHPERCYRTYHTAGSKGKGSTSAYLSALLTGSGKVCGLYTSPHLFTIRERFTLSGKLFPDDFYINVFNKLESETKDFLLPPELGAENPTVFEMYTAYGYMLFREYGCTDAVIETGIGGRLDATNTISPEAVFLTPIELEHTDVLGHTITAIAGEKAKIIRHSPVFISRQKEEAEDVFLREAGEMNAEVHLFRNEIHNFSSSTEKDGEKVSFSIDGRKYSLKLQMATEAMAENAALAVLGAARLGFLTDQGIMNLERMQLPGRFERRMIDSHLVVIDTAHTVNSVATTRDAFMKISSPDPVLIFGAVDGKDIEHMIRELFIPFRRIIISKPGSFKKSSPEKIFELAVSLFPKKDIEYIESPSVAFDSALTLSSDILITGSFYLAAEIERLRGENES